MRGRLERQLLRQFTHLVGVDEVGRGCLAGPVYGAAVVLDYVALRRCPAEQRNLLRDSKTLSTRQRQSLLPLIAEISHSSAIACAEVDEIERLGIVPATFLAMHRALADLSINAEYLLIDGRAPLPEFSGPQQAVIKGDNLCYCIAAASILAKEARDSYMREISLSYPGYGFAQHVGYGTRMHLDAIAAHGVCDLHRRTFSPIRGLVSP